MLERNVKSPTTKQNEAENAAVNKKVIAGLAKSNNVLWDRTEYDERDAVAMLSEMLVTGD